MDDFSKGTEIEWRYLEDGTEVRVSKRTGRIVQLPPKVTNVWDDFVDASKYVGKLVWQFEVCSARHATWPSPPVLR